MALQLPAAFRTSLAMLTEVYIAIALLLTTYILYHYIQYKRQSRWVSSNDAKTYRR